MSWGEGNERLTGNFATKMTLDMITAFQRDTSLPKLKSETSCSSSKRQKEREDVEPHLGGVGVGGLRRGVDLHGLVDAKALLRGEHPHKSSSKPLSFSLSLWTHLTAEAAAVQDYKPETFFFDEKRMLEMFEEIGSVETETNRPRIFGARKRQLE